MMRSFLLLAALQAPLADREPVQPAEPVEPAEAVPPWGGTAAEGLARVAELERSGEREAALELARRLLATDFTERGISPGEAERLRAEIQYAAGVVWTRAEEVEQAVEANLSARALAGPGALRLDASYNAGVALLEEGERQRRLVPEIANAGASGGKAPLVPVPGAPGAPPAATGGEEGPGPLELARASYEAARAHLVERLRAHWRDRDTRANLELVQRRLRELDEIERRREEQQQEQQEQQQDDQDQERQDSESKDEEGSDDEQEPSESEEPSDGDPSEDRQDPQRSEEPRPSEDEPEQQDPGEPEEEPAREDEEEPSDPQDPREEEPQPPAGAEPTEERHLTREEAQRLFDRLAEIEQAAEELRALLRRKHEVPVEKDW